MTVSNNPCDSQDQLPTPTNQDFLLKMKKGGGLFSDRACMAAKMGTADIKMIDLDSPLMYR
jgi:hypothetical protein